MRTVEKLALQATMLDRSCHLRVTRCLVRDRCRYRYRIECWPPGASTKPHGQLGLAATTVGAALTMCEAAFLPHSWPMTGVSRPAVLDAVRFDSSMDLAAMARRTGPPGSRARGANRDFPVWAAILTMRPASERRAIRRGQNERSGGPGRGSWRQVDGLGRV